jgi:hypothetical protein
MSTKSTKLKSNLENAGKEAIATVNSLISTIADYEKVWAWWYVFVAFLHVFIYLLMTNVLWTSETLIGYGVNHYFSVVAYVYLFVGIWGTTILYQSHLKSFKPISMVIFCLVTVVTLLCLVPELLFIIKFSIDGSNCGAVRAGTYSWGTSTNNGTLTGIGGSSISPIVCKDPYYGQWLTINCLAVLMTLGTITFGLINFFVVYKMADIGDKIHKANGGYGKINPFD